MQEILGLCFASMWDIVSSNPDRVYSLVTVLLHQTSLTSYIFFLFRELVYYTDYAAPETNYARKFSIRFPDFKVKILFSISLYIAKTT